MQLLKDLKGKYLVEGITGHYAHGDKMTFGYVDIKKGSILPEHKHPQEQITYIIEGQLDMTIAGKYCPLTKGMFYVIPSDTLHSAFAVTDCVVLDAFSPAREDYK
ncbi:MAG: cupin domain-containing protein [Candidatus Dadabacteria bacterium]